MVTKIARGVARDWVKKLPEVWLESHTHGSFNIQPEVRLSQLELTS